MRLDLYLVEKGYFNSRNKAKNAIDNNAVAVNGKVISKSSFDVSEYDKVEVVGEVCPYVSRGGYKLEAAIKQFYLDFKGKTIVDKKVYSIDVGTNQLDESLLENPNVVSLEQTNILDIEYFPEIIDYFVMDVSFVSITHLLPGISKFIDDENALVCLIKPQFEVGKKYMKNGIARKNKQHHRQICIARLRKVSCSSCFSRTVGADRERYETTSFPKNSTARPQAP